MHKGAQRTIRGISISTKDLHIKFQVKKKIRFKKKNVLILFIMPLVKVNLSLLNDVER